MSNDVYSQVLKFRDKLDEDDVKGFLHEEESFEEDCNDDEWKQWLSNHQEEKDEECFTLKN